jgi:hypothetical protein
MLIGMGFSSVANAVVYFYFSARIAARLRFTFDEIG